MTGKRQLLIVAHAPSPNTQRLRDAVLDGARDRQIDNVQARWIAPLEAGPEDVLAADAVILGTTENLGYMSGALKDFFDRSYYPSSRRPRACLMRLIFAAATTARERSAPSRASRAACAGARCRNR